MAVCRRRLANVPLLAVRFFIFRRQRQSSSPLARAMLFGERGAFLGGQIQPRNISSIIMKASIKKTSSCRIDLKNLTVGDLVATTYSACGEQQAPKILQLAIDSQLVKFKRPQGLDY